MTDGPMFYDRDDAWKAYEAAQSHYETDLQLFSTRMNFFFLVHGALLSLAIANLDKKGHANLPRADVVAISGLGIALSVLWGFVAASSYWWIKRWRTELQSAGRQLVEKAPGLRLPVQESFPPGWRAIKNPTMPPTISQPILVTWNIGPNSRLVQMCEVSWLTRSLRRPSDCSSHCPV